MKRKVVLESATLRETPVEGPTKEFDPDVARQPMPERSIRVDVLAVFYDVGDDGNHRNAYPMILTPREAADFIVGDTYTMEISS